MYQNMTREEMIQRLYEGNFTTGELERQLIAKLFEQCCGGGGSSGGEALIVHGNVADDEPEVCVLDKTAAEIFEAYQSSDVTLEMEIAGEHTYAKLIEVQLGANGQYGFAFRHDSFAADTGNDYPRTGNK